MAMAHMWGMKSEGRTWKGVGKLGMKFSFRKMRLFSNDEFERPSDAVYGQLRRKFVVKGIGTSNGTRDNL